MPYQIHNYAHNNEWLSRSLSQVGRVRDAVTVAKNLIEEPQHPKKNSLKNRGGAAYYGRTRLIETLTRYELWDELVALADTPYLAPTDVPEEQLARLRALGTAHFGRGDVERGKEQIAAITALRDELQAAQRKAGEEAEAKAREEKKSDEQVAKAKADAEKQHKGKIDQHETALAELNGYLTLAEGDAKAALEHFGKAKDLSKDKLSRIYLAAGENDKAEQNARQAVDQGKNQVQPLANYADILFRIGKTELARTTFKQLRELSAYIDAELPVMRRLDAIARDMGIEGEWRIPVSLPSDVGNRPPLETLGPLRWQPAPAPAWELPDSAGHLASLQEYRNRPVLLIFYLGSGCLHCVEQLKKFAPLASEYEAAGIPLVAVSTESVTDMAQSLQSFSESGEFPIRLLANQALDVFRLYRAYDDFEDRPLHGTFLIDGQGLVRWQDISHEPFTDAKFLLDESKRLLSLPSE
jgi:peroxiredoxin/tetratricopeptide (TPR) repeat protein